MQKKMLSLLNFLEEVRPIFYKMSSRQIYLKMKNIKDLNMNFIYLSEEHQKLEDECFKSFFLHRISAKILNFEE